MQKLILIFVLLVSLYGKDNIMIIYGKADSRLDIWITTKFKATKTDDEECKKRLNYFYKEDKEIPAFRFESVDIIPDKNGNYKVEVPLELKDKDIECGYELVDVVLYVGKKGYGDTGNRIDGSLNAVYLYVPNSNENYFRTHYGLTYSDGGVSQKGFSKDDEFEVTGGEEKNALWKLPENEYYILAPESRYECQYRDYKDIGSGTQIRCIMKILKGKIGRIEPIDKGISLKIDIVLNDTDRDGNKYNPKKDYEEYQQSERNLDNFGFFKKIKNKIFGD